MNVKEAMRVLKSANRITLFYGDHTIECANNDAVVVDAFGKYAVDSIMAIDGEKGSYGIELQMRPVVEEMGVR